MCGIIPFLVVNELISREKSEHHQHQQTCQESTEEGAMSSSSSIMAESSAKSNSARSSMQSTTASNSSSSSSGMTPTNDNNNNSTRLDDSSNDSGHNSMNTSEYCQQTSLFGWCPPSPFLCLLERYHRGRVIGSPLSSLIRRCPIQYLSNTKCNNPNEFYFSLAQSLVTTRSFSPNNKYTFKCPRK